ncbi:MAG: hypothetical protein WB774_06995 [Xanthobacteraceae bacterium]
MLAHLRRWRRLGHRYVVEWNGEPVKRISKAHNAAVKAAKLGKDITPLHGALRHRPIRFIMSGSMSQFAAI